jgi:Fe-S-cluster containining protein
MCCRNNTIHFSPQEFVAFEKNVPKNYVFIQVDGQGLETAKQENRDPNILFFNRYSPDIFSDDSRELIRLFVVSCPFLAGNQCAAFGKSYRPQACDSFEFDGSACRAKQLLNI